MENLKTLSMVALIGEPNSGKSTLLNKIAGLPLAVTSDLAGTTRDRQYAKVSWNNQEFLLIDTAGFMPDTENELEINIQKQIDKAFEEANILILVVDGKAPKASLNLATIKKIRKIKKPIFLVINKTDSVKKIQEFKNQFQSLGIKPSFAVSALTGNGIGDLLDAVTETLKTLQPGYTHNTSDSINISIVGKPNVGKSSLFNALLKEERVVVSATPGTTRTAIDSELVWEDQSYTFIDTAGLKKKAYRQTQSDTYSGYQTFKAIRRSDVVVLVVEATSEITTQDKKLAALILSMEKGLVIVVNKLDLYQGSLKALRDYVSVHFPQAWMCPLIFISANKNIGTEELLGVLKPIYNTRGKVIAPETLNQFLKNILQNAPPKRLKDQKTPKVFSLSQIASHPPTFELKVNHPAAIAPHFKKALENAIIRELDFYGTPIVIKLKGKE